MRAFPQLVQLHREHRDQVACISVNVEYSGSPDAPPGLLREPVLKFLTDQGAEFENVLCSEPDEKLYEKLDLASIPAILIYDRNGKLRKRFDNDSNEYGEQGFRYEDHVIPFVKQLLAE